MSGIQSRVGSFLTGTTGNVTISALPFTPKAFIVWGTGPSTDGFAAETYLGMGITDGTNKFFRNYEQNDNQANPSNVARQGTTHLFDAETPAGGQLWEIDTVSFGADSVAVNFVTSPANSRIHYLILGGDDLDAQVLTFATGGGGGNISVGGVAFQPNSLFSLHGQNGNGLGVGVAIGPADADQWSVHSSQQQADPTVCVMKQTIGRFADVYNGNAPGIINELDFVSFDVAGWTYDRITDTSSSTMGALVTAGAEVAVGSLNQPAATGIQTITLAFKPRAIIAASWSKVASGSLQDYVTYAFGAGDMDLNMRAYGSLGENGLAGDSNCNRFSKQDKLLSLFEAVGAPSVVAEMELDSMLDHSVLVDWTTVDATARQWLYFIIGEEYTVTTDAASNITHNSADSGGTITAGPSVTVTQRGVCWSTAPSPTIADDTTNDGAGTGSFVSNLTGLLPNTTYFVRAYSTTAVETSYGNEISFMTGDTPPSSGSGGLMLLGVGN